MKPQNALLRLFFSLFFISFTHTLFAAESLNSVAAIVNNGVITQSELSQELGMAKQQLAASPNPHALTDVQLKQMVLQQLINQKLQLELAAQAHMTISDAKVMDTISKIAQQNHVPLETLKSKLKQQGIPFSVYKKTIHDQMLIRQVEESAVGAQIHVTPTDIQNALKQYRAQTNTQQVLHVIDINVPTIQQAQTIAAQLKKGGDINTVAPNNSKDLGWQTENTLPSLFLQQLSHMGPGDVSAPIQAPNGFHVLKLVGVRGNQTTSPTKEQLKNIAFQMKLQEAVGKWLKTVRKTAYIKITTP